MKYPKKGKDLVKLPKELTNGMYKSAPLLKDGSLGEPDGYAEHHNYESCWICCRAYNIRVGYSDKKVKKILNYFDNGQKKEKTKKSTKKRNRSKNR